MAALLTENSELLNAFFAGGPNGTPGGIVGVADLLTADDPVTNAFITGGIVGLAAQLSGEDNVLNAFFAGGPGGTPGGIVGVLDFLTADDPVTNAFITGGIVGLAAELSGEDNALNAFFAGGPGGTPGGIVGVADFLTAEGGPLADPFVNAFVTGGVVSATEFVLVQAARRTRHRARDWDPVVLLRVPA